MRPTTRQLIDELLATRNITITGGVSTTRLRSWGTRRVTSAVALVQSAATIARRTAAASPATAGVAHVVRATVIGTGTVFAVGAATGFRWHTAVTARRWSAAGASTYATITTTTTTTTPDNKNGYGKYREDKTIQEQMKFSH